MAVDDLYWNSIDFGSEESLPPVHQKNYVDPWDLENYAYIRQHLNSLDLSSDPSSYDPSFEEAVESNPPSFQYVPNGTRSNRPTFQNRYESFVSDQTNSNSYAAIEDVRRFMPLRYFGQDPEASIRNLRTHVDDLDSEIEECPYEESNRDSSLLYIYETKGRCRRIAMPASKSSRERSMSFSYGDRSGYDVYSKKPHLYSRPEDDTSYQTKAMPVYDQVRRTLPRPNNFSLSNYGHLQIDYSSNWNTLDKYICH